MAPFSLDELENELKRLSYESLMKMMNSKDQNHAGLSMKLANTVRLHREHMSLTKFGVLFLVASCVFEHIDDSLCIFEADSNEDNKRAKKEDFVYDWG